MLDAEISGVGIEHLKKRGVEFHLECPVQSVEPSPVGAKVVCRDKGGEQSGDYQNLFDCDLLIIDDLGTEFSNSFTTSQLFLCLNERLLRRKSTIISTNLNIPQLAELYSERTFSRVTSNYTMIKLIGSDIRILKKINGTANG